MIYLFCLGYLLKFLKGLIIMPHLQKHSKNIGKLKLVSMLGTALGWGKAQPNAYNIYSAMGGIYSSKSNSLNLKDKNDFMQNLLEIRLNDVAGKYCVLQDVSPIGIKVIRVYVTAYNDGNNHFIPLIGGLAIEKNSLPRAQFYFANEGASGRIDVFVYSADNEKTKDNIPFFQEQLDKEINNTNNIEKALKNELWHYALLERTKQNGLQPSDLATFSAIDIIHIHDAYIKSSLRQALLEQRSEYLRRKNLDVFEEKFDSYKKAIRDNVIKPQDEKIEEEELIFIGDMIQDLFNIIADEMHLAGRIRLVSSCRSPNYPQGINDHKNYNPEKYDLFIKICSEHLVSGQKLNFVYYQTKENNISQITIDKLRLTNNNMFSEFDENEINAYFNYDKKELQNTIDEINDSIRNYFKEKE